MLAALLVSYSGELSWLNVFRYITFRGVLAVLTSLALGVALYPWAIRKLRDLSIRQITRDDDVPFHAQKGGTPTMGGIVILFGITVSTLLWADLTNYFIWVCLGGSLAFGGIGFLDDWLKLKRQNNKGLTVRGKLAWQTGAAAAVALILYFCATAPSETSYVVPIFKDVVINLSFWFIPITMIVLVGTSNAVNLTDGLDGLVTMPIILLAGGLGIFAYATGHAQFADYLAIPFIENAGEIVIFCASMVGSGLAFLVFNCYPAQLFMGDSGSLALGAAAATVAVIIRQEVILFIMGGLFVIEALSVMSQVASFKLFGTRIWLMSPIHHHFELRGWPEPKITVRFWILSFVLVLTGLATLKIR